MSRVYYRDAVGCLLFFDLTRVQSFRNALRWKYDLDNKVHLPNGQRIPCLLVANKVRTHTLVIELAVCMYQCVTRAGFV